jgi:hypothetical protein
MKFENPPAPVGYGGFLFFGIIDDIEHFGGGFDEDFCTGLEQFVCGTITPEAADGKHTAGRGGFHIGIGIAEVEKLLRREFKLICDLQRGEGVGFDGDIGQGAMDDFEMPAWEKFFDHNLCEMVWLVREDSQTQSAF